MIRSKCSGIEVVITGLTRNQFAGNRTWVRIPPAAPWVGPYRTHPFQLVKERQFSKHEDWRFIIKRGKNHDIGSKIRSIPLPNSNLFEIHGSIFGVETSILARDLAWDWIGDAHERFSVGDEVLVRILNVRRNSLEDLGIRADIKSTSENTDRDNLQKCRIQGKYAGKVTDVHKGVVYVRLANGVNAVAHSCYDYRMPGKKDDVSFAVTHLDVERGIALGIITRIIRQNL